MNKQIIILGVVVMLICVGLSGCEEISNPLASDEDRFVGKWKYKSGGIPEIGGEITFYSDRTVTIVLGLTGNYEIKDRRLVISVIASGNKLQYDYDYSFSENDTILTLDDIVFEKQ